MTENDDIVDPLDNKTKNNPKDTDPDLPTLGGFSDDELTNLMSKAVKLSEMSFIGKGFKVEIHGKEKTGKTLNACSAAGLDENNEKLSPDLRVLIKNGIIPRGWPVIFIDTEIKVENMKNIVKKLGDKILVYQIHIPDENEMCHVNPTASMKQLLMIVEMAYKKYDSGTLVIDSITDVTNWVRKYIQYNLVEHDAEGSELGSLIRLQPSDWLVRDDIWEFLLKRLRKLKQHVILTSREKEDWSFEKDDSGKSKGKTGEYSPRRFKDIPYFMDIEVGLGYEYDELGHPISRYGRIVTCQFDNPKLRNLKIKNMTYPKLLEYVIQYSHEDALKKLKPQSKKVKEPEKKVKQTDKKE